MRTVYILTLLLGLLVMGKAQTFSVYPSDTINTTLDARHSANVYIHFPNLTGQSITLGWEVTNSAYPTGWIMQVCDNNLCYNLPHPNDVMNPVVSGDSGFLKMICIPLEIEGTGTISFHVYDINSPSSSVDVTYNFETNNATSLDASQLEANVAIGPNPAQDHINLAAVKGFLDKGNLKVLDLRGELVLEQFVDAVPFTEVNVQSMKPGMYLIRYESKSGTLTKKFIVTH